MSDWSNLEEIMQDLSVAQGYVVPAALETYSAVGPPAYKIDEEEYKEQAQLTTDVGGSGDFPVPNYRLIQNMLKMVKDEDQDDKGAHSSIVDPPDTLHTQQLKKKTKRNVAISSIMSATNPELSARRPLPKDVIPVMFKKKSLNPTEDTHRNETVSSLQTFSQSADKLKQYTPSANASAYYSKYLEKSQLREHFEEDVWAMAEQQMMELEERKRWKSVPMSPRERGNMSPPGDALAACAVYAVSLREHRHLMPGDCVVCVVHAEHGYYL